VIDFIRFDKCDGVTRLKMYQRNAEALMTLEIAQIKGKGAVWFPATAFPNCTDHITPERPSGPGQIVRIPS
jgi:hypothetical protein